MVSVRIDSMMSMMIDDRVVMMMMMYIDDEWTQRICMTDVQVRCQYDDHHRNVHSKNVSSSSSHIHTHWH